MTMNIPPCSLEEIIKMDRSAILNYDVYLEVSNNRDIYHIVLGGSARSKELDLGNTQRFLGMGIIEEILKRYKKRNPQASIDEFGMAITYYWQHSEYLEK